MSVLIKRIHNKEVGKSLGLSPTVEENVYTIPDGRVLSIDSFLAGHEYSTREARVELVERDGATDTVLVAHYGNSQEVRIESDFVGDGSKKIVIRLINGDVATLNMFGRWVGRERGINE